MPTIDPFLDRIQSDPLNTPKTAAFLCDKFRGFFNQFCAQRSPYVSAITPLSDHDTPHLNTLPAPTDAALLDRVVVLKLNGGLATTMGCDGPKSLVVIDEAKNRRFIDVIQDKFPADRLWFLNSYHTHADTVDYLGDASRCLVQHRLPRVNISDPSNPIPFSHPSDSHQNWAPPGHGNLYDVLAQSNWIDDQLAAGREYVFISNSDNLGATLDARIVAYMQAENIGFVAEATPKTPADQKGGSFSQLADAITLVESAQVNPDDPITKQAFVDLPIFNTNTLWIHLPTLKQLAGQIQTDLICNHKVIDGTPIIQFETAMGSAIGSFTTSRIVIVARDRFIPVKTMADLQALQTSFC